MDAALEALQHRIRAAAERGTPLAIRGGGTKDFYGGVPEGDVIDTRTWAGIVDYEPTELVITARGGTPLAEIESEMHARGQMLAFEPPHFADGATLGGTVAAGLSGPRRPYAGAVRDLVLGVRILDGRGEHLAFGGRVMKNVAGFDVARLMTGALGTLGVITEVSLKCLPVPKAERTRVVRVRGRPGDPDDQRVGRAAAAAVGHLLSRRPAARALLGRRTRRRRRRSPSSAAMRSTRPRRSGATCAITGTRSSRPRKRAGPRSGGCRCNRRLRTPTWAVAS